MVLLPLNTRLLWPDADKEDRVPVLMWQTPFPESPMSSDGSLFPETPKVDIFERARFDDRARYAGSNSACQSTLILCNVIIAMGVLNMPYTFRLQGYLDFLIVAAAALLLIRTSQLTFEVANLAAPFALYADEPVPPKSRDWGYLAGLAYGNRGRAAARLVLMSSLMSYIVGFLSALGTIVHTLVPTCPLDLGIVLATVVSLALTRLPMRVLGQASLVAHGAYLVAFICLLVTGIDNLTREGHPGFWELLEQRTIQAKPTWRNITGIPTDFYMFVFSMAGTSVLPSVINAMQDRSEFSGVLCRSYAAAVSTYIVVGLSGFIFFGPRSAQLLTSNIGTSVVTGADLPELAYLQPIASVTVMCKLLLCIPVLAYPIFSDVKQALKRRPSTAKLVTARPQVLRYLWRAPFLIFMGLIATLFGDQVALAVSVVGALFGTPLICFMPAAVYVGLCRKAERPIGWWKRAELAVIVLAGSLLGCCATVDSVWKLIAAS